MAVMKSDMGIKTDIFRRIKGSELESEVTGVLRKTGKRPAGSKREDIIISMLASQNGQVQTASVNVNVYVAANIVDGQAEEDTKRLDTLCDLCSQLFDSFYGADYRAELKSQNVKEISGADEYVINNKIEYKYLKED